MFEFEQYFIASVNASTDKLTVETSELMTEVAIIENAPLNSTLGQRAGVDVLANGTKVYIIRDGDYQMAAYESMGLAILCTMALTPFGPSAALISGAFFMSVFKKQKLRFNMFKLLGAAAMYITQSVTNMITVRVPQTLVMTGNAVVPIVKGAYTYTVKPTKNISCTC
jgi:hypothetical protein